MRSVKLGFVAAAMLLGTTALTTPAFAGGNNGGHECSYQCGGGNEGGDKGGDIDIDNSNHNYNTANGGTAYGGKVDNDINNKNDSHNTANGGTGGTAYGGKVENKNENDSHNTAYGGKVEDSGNSHVYNNTKNENENKQHQNQDQQQQQNQHQSIKDSGNSYNENDNSNSNNASQDVSVNTYNERAPVNTAYSAGLVSGEDTCMGSSSIGAQAVSFGLTLGTTWQDDNCRRLKNSRQMVALGYHRAATALMCVDEDVKNAMIMAGTPCPNGQVYIAPAAAYVPPAREYVPMAPVADAPVRHRRHKKPLPPK